MIIEDTNKIFDTPYSSSDSNRPYFSSHGDSVGIGMVELHIPDIGRSIKFTVAAAELLITNLQINTENARRMARL